jgi:hypothetical protein
MGFVVKSEPKESTRVFCKSSKISNRKQIQIAKFFDFKGAGEFSLLDDKASPGDERDPMILLDGSLEEVVYLARLIKETPGCNAVRFAWPGGSGVVIANGTFITTIPSDGYLEMSRVAARDELVSDEYTPEEADELLEEEGGAYDNEVDMRDWLQETWQDEAISNGNCPSKQQLKKTPAFAELFKIGFKNQNYSKTELSRLNRSIETKIGKGPSYNDLDKAKAYLTWDANENTYAHRDRCHDFFKNAPQNFLGNTKYFEEIIPMTAGFFVEYASEKVRSNLAVGKQAAQRINGFPDGYRYLVEPALSNHQIICTALSSEPSNLKFAPEKVKAQLAKLDTAIIKSSEGIKILDTDLIRSILKDELIDFIVAWCVGQVQSSCLGVADLLNLHKLVHEFRSTPKSL